MPDKETHSMTHSTQEINFKVSWSKKLVLTNRQQDDTEKHQTDIKDNDDNGHTWIIQTPTKFCQNNQDSCKNGQKMPKL